MMILKRKMLAALALCLAGLTLAACGPKKPVTPDPQTDAEPDSVATEPASTPEAKPELRVPAVYPVPQYTSVAAGELTVDVQPERFSPDANGTAFAHLLTEAGASVGVNGFPLTVTYRDLAADFEYGADEAYILTVTKDGVAVEAQTERGAFYAVTTLCAMLEKGNGSIPVITVKDAPRNPLRGVIEGFYGKAYTHEFRKELFSFMGENKMNAYIYAPKDDAKHRALWRELYSGDELETMRDLVASARQNYVKFIYAISPGGDIDLGGGYAADFDKLMVKCQQMYDLGVRDFAIFLDDIESRDAVGHAKLLTDFQTKFVETHEGVSDLVAITAEYTDSFLTEYTDTIGPLIHEDVELMWTGPGVSPEKIAKPHLNKIIRKYGREVFIWWNYPVNDILVNNLYMGPCEGLMANLHESITGLVANPMNQGYASMVPLFTTADYLWNPETYDPDASLRMACEILAPDVCGPLENFISMTCSSPMNKYTDSPSLKTLLDAYRAAPSRTALDALGSYFDMMLLHADHLEVMNNRALYTDIAEWVAKYRAYAEMGRVYVAMEIAREEGKPLEDLLAFLGVYKDAEASIKGNARLVSPGVLAPFFDTLPHTLNQICGFDSTNTVSLPTLTTSLPVYSNYPTDFACDGLTDTFFWSGRAGLTGDYIQLDLGAPTAVSRVTFNARNASSSEADYIRNGELSYSVDGQTWIPLCAVSMPVNDIEVNITARYLRVEVKADQINWVTISEFSVEAEDRVSENLALDEYFISRYQLITLQDGRIYTALDTDDTVAEGHSLLITVGETGKVTLLSYAPPEGMVEAIIRSEDGVELGRKALEYETVITAPAGSVVEVPLGRGLRIAEVR